MLSIYDIRYTTMAVASKVEKSYPTSTTFEFNPLSASVALI